MYITELTIEQFQSFVDRHPMRNYCQSINFALIKGQEGYDYELIGYTDGTRIYAASLILTKKIGYKCYFGYAPKGFLIDYTDNKLLANFVKDIKEYYLKKDFVFIKINPEIAIGEVNLKTFNTEYNNNYQIIHALQNIGFKKLKNNLNFESLFPRFTGIVPLKNFSIERVKKNTRNKVKKGIRMGLTIEKSGKEGIDIIEKYLPEKINFYYKDLYNIFEKQDLVDVFLVSIDPERFLVNAQNAYVNESNRNAFLNQKMVENTSNENINNKMNSDRALLTYKNDITEASKMLEHKKKHYIAGAITIKDGTRVHVITSGFDKDYKRYVPNYFLYYAIMEYYKDEFSYMDLNGISGDFSKSSPYRGLNRFKLSFNPKVYELIGEFDLILDENNYNLLLKGGLLAKEFNKN